MTFESAPRTTEDELQGAFWHKSSHSGTDNGCVERGRLHTGRQAVRDTTDRDRGALVFDADTWAEFVGGVRDNLV